MGLEGGEERALRASLRQMEGRRQAVERCGLVRLALAGDGDGGGGVEDGISTVEQHLQAVLVQEEAVGSESAEFEGASPILPCYFMSMDGR